MFIFDIYGERGRSLEGINIRRIIIIYEYEKSISFEMELIMYKIFKGKIKRIISISIWYSYERWNVDHQ